ncbi:hypothetical protein ACQ4PT_007600 [Festuca glaucescens]
MIQEAVAAALAAAAQKQTSDVQRSSVQLSQQEAQATAQTVAPSVTNTEVTATPSTDPQAKKAKKLEKQGCFRCKQPGHLIDDCTVPVCGICESIHHITTSCHLLQAPKPSVTMYGFANEGLMFCECPTTGTFRPKVDNAKMAKITVGGDAMTVPEIVEQLKRIIPSDNFQWEVQHYHNNVYKAKFPNKAKVQRAKNFRMYKVPDRDTDLLFDVWSSVEEPLYMLPEVWVRIAGVPSDVRADFLALWGLGTLLRKTKEVDMAYTRKNKVARMLIGCVNHNLIPDTMDVFIKRGFYKLDFVVEPVEIFQDATMLEAHEGFEDDKDGNGGRDGEGRERADMDMDDTTRSDNQSGTIDTQKTQTPAGGEQFRNNGVPTNLQELNAFWVGQIDCSPKKIAGITQQVSVQKNVETPIEVDFPLGSPTVRPGTELSSVAGLVEVELLPRAVQPRAEASQQPAAAQLSHDVGLRTEAVPAAAQLSHALKQANQEPAMPDQVGDVSPKCSPLGACTVSR